LLLAEVDSTLSFLESSIKGGNYFYGKHFSVLHQTAYYAMFLCFSISIIHFKPEIIKSKILKTAIVILLSLVIFQISSRAGAATLIIIILFFLYKKLNRRLFIFTSATSMLIVIPLLLMLNPRLKNTIKNVVTKGISFDNEDNNSE